MIACIQIRAVVERIVACSADDKAPLELTSLDVVDIANALEEEFSVTLTAADVTRHHFASIESLAAMIASKRVAT